MYDNVCGETLRWIYDYLDRELSPDRDAAVRRHLATCEECWKRFHFEEIFLRTIREKCCKIRAPDRLRRQITTLLNRL